MKIDTTQLIDSLLEKTTQSTLAAQRLKNLSLDQLNFKLHPEKWSALQCIEHLNLYGDYYLPEIEKQILEQPANSTNLIFRSGIIGNYFAKLMSVENGKMTKMKSPKDKNPTNSMLTLLTIDRFLKQQERLKSLLEQARHIDVAKTKVSISLIKFIRLRLGDTFRFFVNHIERHILQAEKAVTHHD